MSNEKLLSAAELQLGDIVQVDAISGFGGAAVIGVSSDSVRLFRPYVQLADFETFTTQHGQKWRKVIGYIGSETWEESERCTHKRFTLIRRTILK